MGQAGPWIAPIRFWLSTLLAGLTGVFDVEHLFKRLAENTGDENRKFQRRRIFGILNGDDGLACHTDFFGQILLRHFIGVKSQTSDVVGNLQFSHGSVAPPVTDELDDIGG